MTPLERLGLGEKASADEITQRWRVLRAEHHPDRGGDPDAFHELLQAFEEAHADALQPKFCEPCAGTGRAPAGTGPFVVFLACEICGGTGRA